MFPHSLLRADDVIARRGRSRAQLYVDIKNGTMTPPVRIGPNKTLSAWPERELEMLNAAEIGGASKEELQALVKQLIAKRAELKPRISMGAAA